MNKKQYTTYEAKNYWSKQDFDHFSLEWLRLQIANFKTASQPYYVLLNTELEILNSPIQYTSKDVYQNWLEEGLNNFNRINN